MKVKMTILVELDEDVFMTTETEQLWLENEVFVGDGNLILHSNDIGDSVGVIKKVSNIQWITE